MKKILIILMCSIFSQIFAQKTAGRIIYEVKPNWLKYIAKASYLTQEQKDREMQTWKNHEQKPFKMILDFNEKGSFYTYESQSGESSNGNYTWAYDDKYIIRDFVKNQAVEVIELLGKPYYLTDTLLANNWKILNEIRDISGYLCMKATTVDTIKNQNIEAWFTTDIPISVGPERFNGLPGMILEINVDDAALFITTSKIDLKENQELPPIPKHKKNKPINTSQYNKLIVDYIKQQEALHQMPWSIYD